MKMFVRAAKTAASSKGGAKTNLLASISKGHQRMCIIMITKLGCLVLAPTLDDGYP